MWPPRLAVNAFLGGSGPRGKIRGSCRRPSAISTWVLVGLAFFLSGAAALIYPVAWQRILAQQTGSPPRCPTVWEELKTVRPVNPAPVPPGRINRDLFPRDEFNSPDQ
jgi:hypothetical protein